MATAFKLGADPELFLKTVDGKFISAHDLVPGNKRDPHKVKDGAIQPDGLAAEFNIDAVDYNDFSAFDSKLTSVIKQLKDVVGPDVNFALAPSAQFDAEYYNSLPDAAKELGCDPDFCAYSEDPFAANPRPDGASGLRSAAGHLHIGWGADIPTDHPDHIAICRDFIKQLDCYVGLAMTTFDTDTERRKLYGKAGAYRPKSYGVEYRTPSNAWIASRARRQFIHSMVSSAITNMQTSNPIFKQLASKDYQRKYGNVAEIINAGDATSALRILKEVCGVYVPELSAKPAQTEASEKALKLKKAKAA